MKPEDVLNYWLDEVGEKGWYDADPARDAEITKRFLPMWRNAQEGAFSLWMTYPSGCLAYLILMDQFPRNMFRGSPEAYSTDRAALALSKIAVEKGWDLKIDEPARQFFYLPMMHSECISDQERCIRLVMTRMPDYGQQTLLHARAHRDVIRKFGRFPFRNEALDRKHSAPEAAFLASGGYGATVRELQRSA